VAAKPPSPHTLTTYPDAFLQAILEDPDDDVPRLAYADWLEENGGEADRERAEFIRLQYELARLAEEDRLPELEERQQALLRRYRAAWSRRLSRLRIDDSSFRRGFVEEVGIPARTFLMRAEDLFRRAPVRHVRFEEVDGHLPALTQSPHLSRLAGLSIHYDASKGFNWLREEDARQLASSAHLGRLTTLSLRGGSVGDAGVEALAGSPGLAGLTALELTSTNHQVGDAGAQALAASPWLTRLKALDLGDCWFVTATGARALAGSPNLAGLTTLRLSATNFGDEGVQALASSPRLAGLTALDLYCCAGISSAGVQALLTSPHLTRLSALALAYLRCGPEGVALLAAGAHLAGLVTLNLHGNLLGDLGACALAASPHLGRLVALMLGNNDIGPRGARALARWPCLARLRRLGLDGNRVGDAGVQALAQSPHLGQLTCLDLRGNEISNVGARALLRSPHLPRLTTLYLSSNRDISSRKVIEALRARFGFGTTGLF
jgi:uncharacterized protein (TIGR02996 family)